MLTGQQGGDVCFVIDGGKGNIVRRCLWPSLPWLTGSQQVSTVKNENDHIELICSESCMLC